MNPFRRPDAGWYAALGVLSGLVVVLTYLLEGPALVAGALIAAPWGIWMATRRPALSLNGGFFAVMIAGTKFRERDPLASVGAVLDAQIAFELAIYAWVAWVVLLTLLRMPRRTWRPGVLEAFLIGYVGLALGSVLWSPIPLYTLVRGLQLATLLGYAFVVVRVLGTQHAWGVLSVSIVGYTLLFTLLGFGARTTGLTPPLSNRFTWFGTHPIEAGSFAALGAIVLLAGLLFKDVDGYRFPRFLGVMALVVVLLRTFSRGPLLAFVTVVLSMVMIRLFRRSIATFGAVMVTALALTLVNLPEGLFGVVDRLLGSGIPWVEALTRGQTSEEILSMTGRIGLWSVMFPAFLEHPLVGHGYQVARVVGMQIAPWAGEAHNAVVQSMIDLGVIGTLLLLVPLLGALAVTYGRLAGGPASRLGLDARAATAAQFGIVLFLSVSSVGTAGFAGVPGFEPLLLFTIVAVQAMEARSRRMPDPLY